MSVFGLSIRLTINIVNFMKNDFENFLEDYFMELREIGGMPITKDNFEDLFENWLGELDTDNLIRLGDLYGNKRYLDGKAEVLDK